MPAADQVDVTVLINGCHRIIDLDRHWGQFHVVIAERVVAKQSLFGNLDNIPHRVAANQIDLSRHRNGIRGDFGSVV